MRQVVSDRWFIRVRGQVSGPFDQSQLESLVRRQRLGRHDEISGDNVNWKRAAELPDLFVTKVTKKVRKSPDATLPDLLESAETYESRHDSNYIELRSQPVSVVDDEWYYRIKGRQAGPVSFKVLQEMLSDGRVQSSDPVWTEGMAEWTPPQQLPEFPVRVLPRQVERLDGQVVAGTAVASLVLGILGLTVLFGIASIPAIVFGHWALGQIRQEPERYSGSGQALAGLIMGYIALGLILLLLFLLLLTSQILLRR
jgi:hypothetical protein